MISLPVKIITEKHNKKYANLRDLCAKVSGGSIGWADDLKKEYERFGFYKEHIFKKIVAEGKETFRKEEEKKKQEEYEEQRKEGEFYREIPKAVLERIEELDKLAGEEKNLLDRRQLIKTYEKVAKAWLMYSEERFNTLKKPEKIIKKALDELYRNDFNCLWNVFDEDCNRIRKFGESVMEIVDKKGVKEYKKRLSDSVKIFSDLSNVYKKIEIQTTAINNGKPNRLQEKAMNNYIKDRNFEKDFIVIGLRNLLIYYKKEIMEQFNINELVMNDLAKSVVRFDYTVPFLWEYIRINSENLNEENKRKKEEMDEEGELC